MVKHVAKDSTVDAHVVTEFNIEKIAQEHDLQLMTSVREDGKRFLIVEGRNGSTRIDVGGYLVEHGDGTLSGFTTAEAFEAAYERP